MNNRKVIKGENHHWWPQGLSKYWEDGKGLVQRINFNGVVVPSKPKNFGQISNGHNILFEENSPWESTFEHYFDVADGNMSKAVNWLVSLKTKVKAGNSIISSYVSQQDENENLDILRECIISLIIRSPKYRNAQNSIVESFRGKLGKSESMRLISANIHQKYKTLVQRSKGTGKFAVLFSESFEFIYGDGVYSNITATTEHLNGLKIAIPITPHIVVVWFSPIAYRSNPRLISIEVDEKTVELINNSVQVYSKEYLFYRTKKPYLIDAFKLGEHMVYSYEADPIDRLIDSLAPDLTTFLY